MDNRDYAVVIENLSKTYGELKAVNDISFRVARGSLFAFLGVNGAGKSTTINIICSILSKDMRPAPAYRSGSSVRQRSWRTPW